MEVAPTTKLALSAPVATFTLHVRPDIMRVTADGVMLHAGVPVSDGSNPVPEMVTVVPGSAPKGGEPWNGLGLTTVTAGLTVKVGLVVDGSP